MIISVLHSYRIAILVMLIMLKSFFLAADEFWRLRYSTLISAENQITQNSISSSTEMSTSGHSGNFVFANGIGIGFSTSMTNGNLDNISYKFKNNSLDLSYTIGRSFSFTLGAATMIKGRGEIILNGVAYSTESVFGESFFLNLGIPFFSGEFLLGYRQDNSIFRNYQCQMSGESVILKKQINLVSGQINAGIGFIF